METCGAMPFSGNKMGGRGGDSAPFAARRLAPYRLRKGGEATQVADYT